MRVLPNQLLRFEDKEEHALDFIVGRIRLGLLNHYRHIEGVRRDESEGKAVIRWDFKASGSILSSGVSINPYYILCTAHPDVNVQMMTEKYGQYIVRINDPLALLRRIKNTWTTHELAFADNATVAQVVYNKGELVEPDPYLSPPLEYYDSQKPPCFSREREFRFVLPCRIEARQSLHDHITLDVGDCRDVCALEHMG